MQCPGETYHLPVENYQDAAARQTEVPPAFLALYGIYGDTFYNLHNIVSGSTEESAADIAYNLAMSAWRRAMQEDAQRDLHDSYLEDTLSLRAQSPTEPRNPAPDATHRAAASHIHQSGLSTRASDDMRNPMTLESREEIYARMPGAPGVGRQNHPANTSASRVPRAVLYSNAPDFATELAVRTAALDLKERPSPDSPAPGPPLTTTPRGPASHTHESGPDPNTPELNTRPTLDERAAMRLVPAESLEGLSADAVSAYFERTFDRVVGELVREHALSLANLPRAIRRATGELARAQAREGLALQELAREVALDPARYMERTLRRVFGEVAREERAREDPPPRGPDTPRPG